MIIGDFNAKAGRQRGQEKYLGPFGSNERNKRGERLVQYIESSQLHLTNSFFRKKPTRRWTWISPDGKTKNEIDFILTTDRQAIQDTSVLNISFGSDHRLVRAKIQLRARPIITSNNRKRNKRINPDLLKSEKYSQIVNQLNSTNKGTEQSVNGMAEEISLTITQAAKETLVSQTKSSSKITTPTKKLIAEHKSMLQDPLTTSKDRNFLNKQVRKALRKDIYEFKKATVYKAVENNRGPKVFRRATQWKSETMSAIKKENGDIVIDKNSIVETTREFYQILYDSRREYIENPSDRRAPLTRHLTEDLPDISKEESIFAIKQMKANKATGPDQIPIDIFKYTNDLHITDLQKLFNKVLYEGQIPLEWKKCNVILIHKKGTKGN